MLFLEQHQGQHDDDKKPVAVVGDDGAICGRVLPSQQGVEDIPTFVDFWVAAVDVPHALVDVVSTWAGPVFGGVTTCLTTVQVLLEIPDTSGEQAGSDQIQDSGGDTEENLQGDDRTTVIQEATDGETSNDTHDDGQWEGFSGCFRDTDTTDEDDSFQSFSQGGDEGQDKHGILFEQVA